MCETGHGVSEITLKLETAVAREVIRALENQAAYCRDYEDDPLRAKRLEAVAAELEAQMAEGKPAGREVRGAMKKKTG
jgi:hypothetical protein